MKKCPNPNCSHEIADELVACSQCWRLLSESVRSAIYRLHRDRLEETITADEYSERRNEIIERVISGNLR